MATVNRSRTGRWLSVSVVVAAWAVLAAAGPAPPPAGGLSHLLAVEVEYRAQKLIFSVTTRARLTIVTAASVRDALRTPPGRSALAPVGDSVASLVVETDLPFGRHDVTRILLDPEDGAALQADRVTSSRGGSRTVTRYLAGGVYNWRSSPTGRAEEKLPPERWSRQREWFAPYPAELPPGGVVTDGFALLPLTEAARLDRPGATLRVYVPSYHNFLALDFVPTGFERRDLRVEEQTPTGLRRHDGPRLVRVVRIAAHAVPGTGRETPHELGVLGFQGDVTLLVDARTGVPLTLIGRADYIGMLTAKLVRVRFAYEPPA